MIKTVRFSVGRRAIRFATGATVTLLVAAALAGCPSSSTPPKSGPAIAVLPSAFNFGAGQTTDSLSISNIGDGVLLWTIGPLPTWLSVSPGNGSTPLGGPAIATLTVDRSTLVPGTYQTQFLVGSNGGNRTISVTVQVAAAPLPPTLHISPPSLDFGTSSTSINLAVSNSGQGTVNWTLDAASLPSWLVASPASGSVSAAAQNVGVTVIRASLSSGLYNANINFTSNGGNISVLVQMQVPGPSPLLSITPNPLAFGSATTELQLTIKNTGTGTLNWSLSESLPWVSLSATSGTTTSETDTVTVTVDRTGQPAGPLAGVIAATSNGGASNIDVTANVAPAQLVVTPTTLNFGTFTNNRLFAISNGGTGTVNWTINTAGFPSWLSVGTTSGSVPATQSVLATVNRAALAPGNYSYTFTVNGGAAGSIDVTVFMSKATQPVLVVDTAGSVTGGGEPLAALGDKNNTLDITIANGGTGTLNWSIDPTTFPSWLTMAPVQGSLSSVQTNTVTITISRLGLGTGGYSAVIPVTSNGGNTTLNVTMQVPLRPAIGVSPNSLEFGLGDTSSSFSVANIGDPSTILNFLIVSSEPNWLFQSPATGSSIGTSSPVKDFKDINVSIDRTGLNGTSQNGFFTIFSLDGNGDIDPDIEPVVVPVTVQITPLSFQVGPAHTRIPSMVKFLFLMRDFRNSTFFVAPEVLNDPFHIFEDGIAIEQPSETTQLVQLQNSTLTQGVTDFRVDLRTKVVLLLDYSGSMKAAAESIGTTIQDVYEDVGGQFITDFFANLSNVERGFTKMAIMEFHDRAANASIVQDFTTDPATLIASLQAINLEDNGATALLPAIEESSAELVDDDVPYIDFDDADIRAVVLLSDGRLTTPPGKIQDTIDALTVDKTRLFAIGFGNEVNHEPLVRLASGTGGNYYLTRLANNGLPDQARFKSNLQTCADDLASFTILSYISLGEADNVPIRFDGALDDPNDSPDQGIIQGTIHAQNVKLGSIVGDIKLGQISMRNNGIVGGATRVTLRADYVPRNVNKFKFTVISNPVSVPTVTIVPLNEGGLVDGWTLTPLGGTTYLLSAPPNVVIPYGEFGDLVHVDYSGMPASFTEILTIDNSIYSVDNEPKSFIYPDTMLVGSEPFLAPAFPAPLVTPRSFDFGTTFNNASFTIQNIGGSFPYGSPDVLLDWTVEDLPTFITSAIPNIGSRGTTVGTDTFQLTADRTLPIGSYTGILSVRYTGGVFSNNGGPVNITGVVPVFLSIRIDPPTLLTVPASPVTLFFNPASQAGGFASLTFDIHNSGQSTLLWAVSAPALPSWISSVFPLSDSTTNETDTVTVVVDPNAPGLVVGSDVNTSFTVISNGGSATINVHMIVGA